MRGTFSFKQRLRYRFDNLFARGTLPVMLALSLALLLLFVVAGAVQAVFAWGPADEPVTFFEGFWLSLTRSLDPGTFGADVGPHFRSIGLLITICGLVALASMIGLISSAIDGRLASLRAGRSLVVEEGHTLILGWSAKVPSIVAELVEANAHVRNAVVVLLSEESVEYVESRVTSLTPDMKGTRLVVRTGDPTSLVDLARVHPAAAKSVIVVAHDHLNADSHVVKSVLGVIKLTSPAGPPIVVEVRRRDVADALTIATRDRTIVLVAAEIVARLAAHVTREAGLSVVYQELLDFAGNEIYMTPANRLVGEKFGASLLSYPSSTVIGIASPDGTVSLNPPMHQVIRSGDSMVVLSEDDATIGHSSGPQSWTGLTNADHRREAPRVESTLIVGWSHYVPLIAKEMDEAVAPGSRLDIVFDPSIALGVSYESVPVISQTVRLTRADILDLTVIEQMMTDNHYDHVLIVCYRDSLDPAEADSSALLQLMAVRNHPLVGSMNVVTELMQAEDAALAELARPDDFVVSERLMSLTMAQVSENPNLASVFRSLLDNDTVSLSLKPWRDYAADGHTDFAGVIAAARDRGETAIGWRCLALAGHSHDLGGAVFINPPKGLAATFADDDRVIVLS
ncbi:unannotated protein [freshwater metagenome]|uniref:Unannotated protein n=1 Tax=freshwater metagenome TaxID=449393 RepID=A0A6J7KME9_9ZZZZ